MIKPQALAKYIENRHLPPSLMDDGIIQVSDPMFVSLADNKANGSSQIIPPIEPRKTHNAYSKSKGIATKEAISPPINNTKLPDHAFEKPNGIPSNNIISISTYNSPIRNASEENQNMENHPN